MPKGLKKALDITTTVALVLFVIFVILLAGVRLFGIEPHIVLSGSMEPEIMTGSLVYVKPISQEEARSLKVGDTVTYVVDKNGTKVTHKIYEVVGTVYQKNQNGEFVLDENGEKIAAVDGNGVPLYRYTTYGINNKNASEESGYTLDGKEGDGNLDSVNVVGRPVFSIPFLGYIANYVQAPPGQYVAIGGCFILIIMTLFTSGKDKKKDEETENAEDGEKGGEEIAPESAGTEDARKVNEELEALKRELAELKAQKETEKVEETEKTEEVEKTAETVGETLDGDANTPEK